MISNPQQFASAFYNSPIVNCYDVETVKFSVKEGESCSEHEVCERQLREHKPDHALHEPELVIGGSR